MKLRISIQPKFFGSVSIGTVELIKLIQKQCDLGLREAKKYVDRAVFENEIVDIPLPQKTDAIELLNEIEGLETTAEIKAELIE